MDPNQPIIDIGGQQIPLGSEFKVGPITSTDIFHTTSQSLEKVVLKLWGHAQLFLLDVRAGKSSALMSLSLSVALGAWIIYLVWYNFLESEPEHPPTEVPAKEPIILRDFTIDQLRDYDGTNGKPIYIGLDGDVYDVSGAPEYYGVGAAYHCFAGRNATRAMAKFSFEETELSNNTVSDLSPFEKSTLEDWVQKFKYFKCYPVVGKYSFPPNMGQLTHEKLAHYNGSHEIEPDRVNSPVYLCLKSVVYDVSYGGFELYGPDGPYHLFAGKDASRALAKMSFQVEDVESWELSDLSEQQLKTLDEWIQKFEKVKKYPLVGSMSPN